MDFNTTVAPTFVSSLSFRSGYGDAGSTNATVTPGSITWVANVAVYIPFSIPWRFPLRRVFWVNGATVGTNCDMGVYSPDGNRLYSTGSTVQAGASTLQYVTANDMVLTPGLYYVGLSCSGTTTALFGNSTMLVAEARIGGIRQETAALPLPAAATFAAYAQTGGVPMFGLSRSASGI